MTAIAIYELRKGYLYLLPGSSTLPDPLRSNLEAKPITLSSSWYAARCARNDEEIHVELDNHADVPGAKEAAFTWAHFVPCHDPDTGEVSGVRARYE